jgi:arylsulfatase A-like enzyme
MRIKLIILVLLAISYLGAEAREKKNLLFIMTDQQRYDALGIAGNTVLETPNLDRLARQGAWFRNAYTPCAVCVPARSSILTGCTVEHTGMRRNDRAYYYEEEEVMTMPTFDEILSKAGYACEYYGKWHSLSSHTAVYTNPKQAAENGKSVFGPGGQRYVHLDYLEEREPIRALKPGELYDTMTKRPYKKDSLDKHYEMTAAELEASGQKFPQCDMHGELLIQKENSLTAFQAKECIEALERLKDEPFSITCSFHFPHAPMLPPEPYYSMYPAKNMLAPASISDDMENSPYKTANGRLDNPEYSDPELIKYMISNYYGLVKEIDDWVGEILDKLDELGLAENTLVIFTSDHGEMLGAHGLREKNVFYEESAHIPLMMRLPGEIESETTVEGYVSNVDLFATILDYLGMEEHPSDGLSLRGLVEGTDSEHGEYVVTEWNYRGDIAPNYMIVKGGWKLMIPYSKSSNVMNAMYDLSNDPHEVNNLLGNNPEKELYEERAEELRECLLEWLSKNHSKHFTGVRERDLL